jgi:hypothetical protein
MSVIQRSTNLLQYHQSLSRRQWCPHFVMQGTGGNIFHHNVADVILLAKIVHRQNIWMIQLGNGFGLAGKTFGKTGFMRKIGRQYFHGHITFQRRLKSLIDGCHSAFADLFNQLVLSEGLPQHRLHNLAFA